MSLFHRRYVPSVQVDADTTTNCTSTTHQDLDSSSGCEMSFDSAMRSPSPTGRMQTPLQSSRISYSPPYKTVRNLRLFDSPHTPKTIIEKSAAPATPMPLIRSRLFEDRPKAVPSAYLRAEKPAANVNPFTPDGMLLSKKRSRSIRGTPHNIPKLDLADCSDDNGDRNVYPSYETNIYDVSCSIDDLESEQPTKRVALQENNISRYHQEFHELNLIGSGQFGSVYRCINRLDGCVYAVKKSTRPVAGSAFEKTALNEVYAHAVLGRHQHVVRYYSAWAEDNHMIIQNEYCNGGSLADRIQSECLDAAELRKLLQHVAEGLRYIHSEALVHLDIKPANIFISKEKRVQFNSHEANDDGFEDLDDVAHDEEELTYKIGDLGHVTGLANPQVEEGDCRYLPAEILHEDYSHLTKADVFSLGLTVIECAGFGPLPKNGDAWHELRRGVVPKAIVQRLPREMIDLIRSMIEPNANHRPSALQILHHPALCAVGNKTRAQLHRELNAEKLKNVILAKQLKEAAICIKSIAPETTKQLKVANGQRLSARLLGKKVNRSISTTTF